MWKRRNGDDIDLGEHNRIWRGVEKTAGSRNGEMNQGG
jgi:hypothetical protein